MKKCKKITIGLMALATMLTGIGGASAAVSSPEYIGPDAYSGRLSYSPTYSLTAQHNGVWADEVEFEITREGQLRSTVCVADSTRTATVTVWEDDQYPNDDDLVVKYRYQFQGYVMKRDQRTLIDEGPGLLDSSDDPTVELYNTVYVQPKNGDGSGTNGNLYRYKYHISNR